MSGWSATRLCKVDSPQTKPIQRSSRCRSVNVWLDKKLLLLLLCIIKRCNPPLFRMLLLAVWLCVKTAEGLLSRIHCQNVSSSFVFQSVCCRNSDTKLFIWIINPISFIRISVRHILTRVKLTQNTSTYANKKYVHQSFNPKAEWLLHTCSTWTTCLHGLLPRLTYPRENNWRLIRKLNRHKLHFPCYLYAH